MNTNILTVLVVLLIAAALAGGLFVKSTFDQIDGRFVGTELSDIEIRKSLDRQTAALDSVKALADSNAAAIAKLREDDDD